MAKPTVILLPGLLCDHAVWQPQMEALQKEAFIKVADLRHGASLGAMAERVLSDAPERFAIAGLSMGGYLAFEILRRAPHRVDRLAIFDSTARPDSPEQTRRRRLLMALSQRKDLGKAMKRLLPQLLHPDHAKNPILVQTVEGMAQRVGHSAFVRQQQAIINRPDSRPDLSQIDCPTLVVCGQDDQLTPPPLAKEITDAIPGAQRAVLHHCGHLSPLERPKECTALLKAWLSWG